ncbi:exo-alpha-sialidase [Gryllotalpicola reticulitermitis]|uniref:exo-alpha-sialidase n=1 Tax=Gryllotalpicola reticulitermitis TaxID=1184153 RepID=A0ABV8Q873_9MICO
MSPVANTGEYDRESERVVFSSGSEAPSTRIPALLACADGSLLAFAELRDAAGDAGHIAIGMRRSCDAGNTWGPVAVVCDDGANTWGNPVPVQLAGGRILLVTTWNLGEDTERAILDGSAQDSRRVRVLRSDDGGETWSDPVEITDQVKRPSWRWYATGPGSAEPLASGRVLIAANHSDPAYGEPAPYRSHLIYSDDGGDTWAVGAIVEVTGSNEAQSVQLADGRVVMYLRDQRLGGKWLAESGDDGCSVDRVWRAPLRSTACQGAIVRLASGALLVTHHAHHSRRRRLALRLSPDGGTTWGASTVVCEGPSGYADLVALPDGSAAMLFETEGDIVFARIGTGSVIPASAASSDSGSSSSP